MRSCVETPAGDGAAAARCVAGDPDAFPIATPPGHVVPACPRQGNHSECAIGDTLMVVRFDLTGEWLAGMISGVWTACSGNGGMFWFNGKPLSTARQPGFPLILAGQLATFGSADCSPEAFGTGVSCGLGRRPEVTLRVLREDLAAGPDAAITEARSWYTEAVVTESARNTNPDGTWSVTIEVADRSHRTLLVLYRGTRRVGGSLVQCSGSAHRTADLAELSEMCTALAPAPPGAAPTPVRYAPPVRLEDLGISP